MASPLDSISTTAPDARFWELADIFIAEANRLAQANQIGKVSAALMYAASRYNAFALEAKSGTLADHKEEALTYLVEQYRKMCAENIEVVVSRGGEA